MTLAETLMQEVMTRLTAITPAPLLPNGNIRRWHRTPVTRDNAPAVQLIDGPETPDPSYGTKGCERQLVLDWTVVLFLRELNGIEAADPLKIEIMRRLEATESAPYPPSVRIIAGRINPEMAISDVDTTRIEMEFKFKYVLPGWGLEA